MGRATRWFKGLFGVKNKEQSYSCSRSVDNFSTSNGSDKLIRDKKRWSFGKFSGKDDFNDGLRSVPVEENAAWLMNSYVSEKDQNKHAIAVAAATAAAADAAVAAAKAAVAVVCLTSQGRGTLFSGGRDRWAALKIQSCFRGYLARRALRALKGLVKIQALVRGFLVRKRATATLYSMQALIRAQAAVRLQRARRSLSQDNRTCHEYRARKSNDRSEETRSEFHSKRYTDVHMNNGYEGSPKIVEIDTFKTRSRSRRINPSPASDSGEDYPHSSPLPYPISLRTKIVECHDNFDWTYSREDCKFPTAQSTPRFQSSMMLCNVPTTPSRSLCGDGLYGAYPNYMSNTQSFKAKLRSHSAPKQRPEPGPKKRLSLSEVMASRTSFSGVKMQRSCTKVQEVLDL